MILAFGHKARQGKGTAGEAVCDYYNSRRETARAHLIRNDNFDTLYPLAQIVNFADELYKVCREEYGMTTKDSPLLQKIGNGHREEFGEDYWIKKLEAKVKKFSGISIITDMRYKNEAEWVESNRGETINVRRLQLSGEPYVASDRDPYHVSETQLDGYDYDHYIVSKSAAETAEIAITIAEFIRALRA